MKKNNNKKTIEAAKEIVNKAVGTIANGIGSCAGEALSACETKKAAADIQAKGELYNLQLRAMREAPKVVLNPAQEEALLFPEFRGQGAYIYLDHIQADSVTNHMLKQYSLDDDSRGELADTVAPLVGVPNMMRVVCHAHEYIGKHLVLPYANHGKPDEYKKVYEDIINDPVYTGTIHGIVLRYNLHSTDVCRNFCGEYEKSRKHVANLVNDLQHIGVQIAYVRADGIHLEVYLKWT